MKNKISILVLFASITLVFTSFAQNVKTKVTVDFKINNLGFSVDGTFKESSVTNNFTNPDYQQWQLYGTVNVNSITTGNTTRDEHLLEDDYFDAAKHPEITLEATSFKKVAENTYNVAVKLTIKGTTKRLTVPIEIIGDANSFILQCDFEINRRDYEVGGRSMFLSNTVRVSVNYLFKS
jgi:polyisoprenoid-binding protein YceI